MSKDNFEIFNKISNIINHVGNGPIMEDRKLELNNLLHQIGGAILIDISSYVNKQCVDYSNRQLDNEQKPLKWLIANDYFAIDGLDPKSGKNILHLAAERGDEDICKIILDKGANINAQSQNGKTALHFCTELHPVVPHKEVGKMLLENKANPNIQDNKGDTPLHLAAHFNKADFAVTLLKAGADNKIKNTNGKIAAQLAPDGSVLRKHLNQDFGVVMAIQLVANFANTPDARNVTDQLGRNIINMVALPKIVPGETPQIINALPIIPALHVPQQGGQG